MFWGVLQNGSWGPLNQHSGAVAAEGGYCLTHVVSRPWLRGGFLHAPGDANSSDNQHNTFFQILPTPRVYARFPFFDMENTNDQFAQLIDNPSQKLEIRSYLHFLHLASNTDLWYQGGGAYDNKVFGYTGRPANLHTSSPACSTSALTMPSHPLSASTCTTLTRLADPWWAPSTPQGGTRILAILSSSTAGASSSESLHPRTT